MFSCFNGTAALFFSLQVMCLHYSYRGWIYPYLLRPHPGAHSNFSLMPALGGWMVTITHGYLNGRQIRWQQKGLDPFKGWHLIRWMVTGWFPFGRFGESNYDDEEKEDSMMIQWWFTDDDCFHQQTDYVPLNCLHFSTAQYKGLGGLQLHMQVVCRAWQTSEQKIMAERCAVLAGSAALFFWLCIIGCLANYKVTGTDRNK